MKARLVAIAILLGLGWGFWSSGLDHPWQLMFESGGQFFSGVARVHLDKGLGFTRGHDWIYNEDNPYEWKGTEPREARAYGHHPPALGLSLAAVFGVLGQSRAAARAATVASHLVSLLLLLLVIPRWTRGRPAAAVFAGLVVVLAPMSGFFGRNVSHEAWLMPWILLAVATYVRRIERGGDGTRLEDGLVCLFVAVAAFYDWPGFYLPPILVLFEAGRGRALGRLNRWLVASTALLGLLVVGHLAWAAPGGIALMVSGAGKRVDPRVLGFTWGQWIERVFDFTATTYTWPVLWAAALTLGAWLVRLAVRSRAGGPAAAFVAIWLAFAIAHIVAFPGGSWVHPYWMFYLMPAIAVAAGLTAGEAWHARAVWLRWPLRAAVAVWLVDVLCRSHETLVWWLAVGAHPTGNPFVEWPPGALPSLLCGCWRDHGLRWPLACGGSLAGGVAGVGLAHWPVVLGFAIGGALLLVLLRGHVSSRRAQDALLLAGLGAILLSITPAETVYDAALRQARALLAGHVSLAERISWLEMFRHDGRFYFSYPPMVSFVLVPWVLVTAGHGGQPLFNTLLLLASALLLHALLRGLEGVRRYAALGTIAYALGTPLVYSAAVGNVWLLMHSEAGFFLLLALWLGFVRRAWGWAGFFLMTGAQCRYAVGLAGVAFLVRFWREAPPGNRWPALLRLGLRFGLPMLPPLAATLAFQWAAFGDPLATPYTLSWNEWGPHGADFSPEYFLRNLRLYMLAAPELLPVFPFARFDAAGQSIWTMSPFFLGVWLARWRYGFVRAFAPAAVFMGVFYCLYWWTGYAQYGTRYMQDLYPLLVPLTAAGFARPGRGWPRAFAWLVAVSVAINLYGAYVVLNVQR